MRHVTMRLGAAIAGVSFFVTGLRAEETPPEVVISIEFFPAQIRADLEGAPIQRLIDQPVLAEFWRSVRHTTRRVLNLQDRVGEPSLGDVAALWGRRFGFYVWRRTSSGDAFGSALAAEPADPDQAPDVMARLASHEDRGDAETRVLRFGERVGPPLSALLMGDRVVATADEGLLTEAGWTAASRPPAGRIWARLRLVPEPWLKAMGTEPAAFIAATLRRSGIDCVRCLDATLRWDASAERFVSVVFVRLQGGPVGWLSVPAESPPNPDVLRSVPAASVAAAVVRVRPTEVAKLVPPWLPEPLASAFEGTLAVAMHRDTPETPPQFTLTLLTVNAEAIRAHEAAVLRDTASDGVVERDIRGRATLYTERIVDGQTARPGWSWVVLDDRVILGRNPLLVGRAAAVALEGRPDLPGVDEFRAAWDSRPADAVGFVWIRRSPVLPRTTGNVALAVARLAGFSADGVARACTAWVTDALQRCEALPVWMPDAGMDGPGQAVLRRTPEGFLLNASFPLPPGLLVPSLLPEPVVRALAGE